MPPTCPVAVPPQISTRPSRSRIAAALARGVVIASAATCLPAAFVTVTGGACEFPAPQAPSASAKRNERATRYRRFISNTAPDHKPAGARWEVELFARGTNAPAKRVHRRAQEHPSGKDAALARLRRRFAAAAKLSHQSEQLIDVDARCDFFERAETYDSLAVDHKCCGKCDAAFFGGVEQSVCLDDFAPRVA